MPPPELLTRRLCINGLVPEDAEALYRYRSAPSVAAHQGWVPASVQAARDFIARDAATPFGQTDAWHQLAVRRQDARELIGDLGVHVIGEGGEQVEIGVTIAPAHQRNGFGAEAVVGLLAFLFADLNKHRVTASVDPRNTASVALLKKVGMRREAHFRKSLRFKGEWVDDVIFALLRTEWPDAKRRYQR